MKWSFIIAVIVVETVHHSMSETTKHEWFKMFGIEESQSKSEPIIEQPAASNFAPDSIPSESIYNESSVAPKPVSAPAMQSSYSPVVEAAPSVTISPPASGYSSYNEVSIAPQDYTQAKKARKRAKAQVQKQAPEQEEEQALSAEQEAPQKRVFKDSPFPHP
jgi:hypothetical protein